MKVNGKFITEHLTDAFDVAGQPAIPMYGREPNFDDLEKRLKENKLATWIKFTNKINNELTTITDGYWINGFIFVEIYHKDEQECLSKMDDFISMGLESKFESKSIRRTAPFEIGNLNFLKWWPIDSATVDDLDVHFMAVNKIEVDFHI